MVADQQRAILMQLRMAQTLLRATADRDFQVLLPYVRALSALAVRGAAPSPDPELKEPK